jgi:tripartite-type tricarboxylate transporter receptor subunit TctC
VREGDEAGVAWVARPCNGSPAAHPMSVFLARLGVARVIAACCALLSVVAAPLHADTGYPKHPITIVVIATGGAPDLFARLLAPKLEAALGQSIVVEARPGAGGNIAAAYVAKAAPDGYTLLMHSSLLAIGPSLYHSLPFDAKTDLVPIAQVANTQMVVLVNTATPVASLQDFVRYAKAAPQSLNYGSAGNGTIVQMACELFKRRAGVDMVHVPYKGSAPELAALLAGDVQMTIDVLPVALPLIKGGRLKALAVTSPQRALQLPDVPTTSEAGLPGLEVGSWNGLFAPAKTPPAIVAQISKAVAAAMADQGIRQRMIDIGAEPVYVPSDAFARFFVDQMDRWSRVVKETGIHID